MGRDRSNVWKYFRSTGAGGSCKYCNFVYKIKNATKMVKHIQSCVKCPVEVKRLLAGDSETDIRSMMVSRPAKLSESAPLAESSTELNSTPSRASSLKSTGLRSFMDHMEVDEQVCFFLQYLQFIYFVCCSLKK